jgi:hypothetical protein
VVVVVVEVVIKTNVKIVPYGTRFQC